MLKSPNAATAVNGEGPDWSGTAAVVAQPVAGRAQPIATTNARITLLYTGLKYHHDPGKASPYGDISQIFFVCFR